MAYAELVDKNGLPLGTATNPLAFMQRDAAGNVYGSRQSSAATITSGAAVSGKIDLSGGSGLTMVGLLMPAAWTAAAIGFQITFDDGTTWFEAYTTAGVPLQIASPVAGKYHPLDPADFNSFAKFRLHSATAGTTTDVNQGADRVFSVIARSF